MKKEYCEQCDSFVDYEVSTEKLDITVKGVDLTVDIKMARCTHCHNAIFVKKIEKENNVTIYDAYKRHENLLTSSQIKAIREKHNMTQIEFARLLHIGDKDITRYENGGIQNKSIDLLIRLTDVDFIYERIKKENKNEK